MILLVIESMFVTADPEQKGILEEGVGDKD